MNQEQTGDGAETEQGGVFGKLPASRPGTRSPRRDTAAKATKAKPAKAKATASATKRKPAASPRARPASKPRPQGQPAATREPAGSGQQQGEQGGLDDLAWAGVAAVAEAATLGVRLANRALGALRDSVDRR